MLSAAPPSSWIVRWTALVDRPGPFLDLASGAGRHAKWLFRQGYTVTAVDRDAAVLSDLDAGIEAVVADLEDGSPWPLNGREFAGIVVSNYLHRPLFPRIGNALAPGGMLIYETFAIGNERFGHPRNPRYLLRPGELLEFCRDHLLVVYAYECVEVAEPRPALVQRVAAARLH